MLTKQLKALIDSSLASGRNMGDIREVLKKQGFLDSAITELFNEYKQGEKRPVNSTNDIGSNVMPVQAQPSVAEEKIKTNISPALQQPEPKPEPEKILPRGSINVGLGGIPELQNAVNSAYELKKKKSIIPLLITFVIVISVIVGFAYWYIYLRDGGKANQEIKFNIDKNIQEKNKESGTNFEKDTLNSAEIDPYTGEPFK